MADPSVVAVLAVLPQTQCRRCGYDDCRAYAEAIAADGAAVNRCPPGGAEASIAWRVSPASPPCPSTRPAERRRHARLR